MWKNELLLEDFLVSIQFRLIAVGAIKLQHSDARTSMNIPVEEPRYLTL